MSEGSELSPPGPVLRPIEMRWVEQGARRFLHLSDPLRLAARDLLVPPPLAALLPMFDGARDPTALRSALLLRHGIAPSLGDIESLVRELDDALLLAGPRFDDAHRRALAAYRQAPFRPPALAGAVYPSDPADLHRAIEGYYAQAPPAPTERPVGPLLGVLTPHIDYERGHRVYATLWQRARHHLRDCELVVVLGTDHYGGLGKTTLTRQHYATPWGTLPTDLELVEAMVRAAGEDASLGEELHHATEHSIELALVWLHHALRQEGVPIPSVVPILCGPMEPTAGDGRSSDGDTGLERLLGALVPAVRRRRTLVVAAGDLAHVGPAFGDPTSVGTVGRADVRAGDVESLGHVCRGDAAGFLGGIARESDRRRVCGLTPIYLALRLLGEGVSGEVVDYAQCPADPAGGSLVSIAGVVWHGGR